jgi:hypothetical protein
MSYPGGKSGSGVYQVIICQQPPHVEYVEPFLGGGAVMRRKLPAAVNVGVDLDERVITSARAEMVAGTWLHRQVDRRGPAGCVWRFDVVDAIDYLRSRRYSSDTLVYVDPPYLWDVRRQHRRVYRCELTDAEHVALLQLLVRLPCLVQVSGYWSELYSSRLAAWRVVRYRAQVRSGGTAEECLWMNYPEPAQLHDYSYVGGTYRGRENVRRRRDRWLAKLARLPAVERSALVAALAAGIGGPAEAGQPGSTA